MTAAAKSYELCTSFDITNQAAMNTKQAVVAERTAATILTLSRCAMDFAGVERVPRYDSESRENDAEHSFMLALVAPEIASQFFPRLDPGLVARFSVVHDLVELETNDVATYTLDTAELAAKEAAELRALDKLAHMLPRHTRELLLRYEAQTEPEARFVRLVDKLLPVAVDILGPGKQVMAEDYGIATREQLDANEQRLSCRLRERFPDIELDFLHLVRDVLARQFAAEFNKAVATPTPEIVGIYG